MEKVIQMILNATHDAMIAVDKQGLITLFNRSAEKLTGQTADMVLGRPVAEVVENTRLIHVMASREAELNKRQQLGAVEIVTNRIPLIDENDDLLGAVAIFRDITEVVALAGEITNLKEIQVMLEAVFRSTQDAISVVDQDGKHILVNPAYSRIMGFDEKEVIGKNYSVDLIEGESVHKKVLETGKLVDGILLRGGRLKRDVIASAAPILVNGKIRGSVAVIHDISEIKRLNKELDQAKQIIRNLEAKYTFDDIKGKHHKIMEAKDKAEIAAKTPATVILRGESGTGKELFAHAIHNASPRRNAQFVRVNCAAISESILESELFGYEEGAFTGAVKGGRVGLFERASGGTIFLDEIGEINLSMQAKLLRVIQEREIVRVGGTKPIPIDVRIISATNVALETAVKEKRFREDLYYRLNVVPIQIPPLREHMEDLEALLDQLLLKYNQEYGRHVSEVDPQVYQRMRTYEWPGNVRELENYIGRAMINMKITDYRIELKHLPIIYDSETAFLEKQQVVVGTDVTDGQSVPLSQYVQEMERAYIQKTLAACGNNKTKAARQLGISVRSLYYKIDETNQ